jgi:hypothetical protein
VPFSLLSENTMKNADSPASPVSNNEEIQYNYIHKGLTKREYIATMMAQGMLASGVWKDGATRGQVAIDAVDAADVLLATLSD